MADQRWKDMCNLVAGRRRGQLWRSDRDYHAMGGIEKTGKQVMTEMKEQVKIVRKMNTSLIDNGWTKERTMKKVGSVPMYIMMGNPEFWVDDAALNKFLDDNPKWKVGT